MAGCERDKLDAPAGEVPVAVNEERLGRLEITGMAKDSPRPGFGRSRSTGASKRSAPTRSIR
jgi:hypothetical protein